MFPPPVKRMLPNLDRREAVLQLLFLALTEVESCCCLDHRVFVQTLLAAGIGVHPRKEERSRAGSCIKLVLSSVWEIDINLMIDRRNEEKKGGDQLS